MCLDGPGSSLAFQEVTATESTSILLNLVRDVLKPPSQAQIDCHFPKQIFVSTGEIEYPYQWQPVVVPIQIMLLGAKFVFIGIPAEITTMAGRRLKSKKEYTDWLLCRKGLSKSFA